MKQEKKNILFVSAMQSWGGGEEFILKLAKYLVDFNFVIASPPGEAENIFKENRLNVFVIKSLSKVYKTNDNWNSLSKIKMIFKIKISFFPLSYLLNRSKVNLIIANGNFAALFSIIPAFILKKRLIVIQHLIYNRDSFESKLLKLIIKFSDKFICVSNAVKENIISIIGERSNQRYNQKLIVIYNGIELPDEKLLLKKGNDDKIKIGVVGSIIRIKGIDLVIDALTEIVQQNSNVHLFIYGTTNNQADSLEFKKELENKIEVHSLKNNNHFMGYENNKLKIYNSLDIVINYTTIPEAFPFSVLEGMSFNKIVIAANIGGPKEIILENENGFLVEPNDVVSLKLKIEFLINELRLNRLGYIKINARKTIEDKFNLPIFLKNYKELFKTQLNICRR